MPLANVDDRMYKILLHNYILPTSFADIISQKNCSETKICLVFYSSAVSQNFKAYPHYCAAKAALEIYFKSLMIKKYNNLNLYLFRLGLLDIRHKYYHSFSQNNPIEFNKFLTDNVPSRHFTHPIDVAKCASQLIIDNQAANGLVCDLSGGCSWV